MVNIGHRLLILERISQSLSPTSDSPEMIVAKQKRPKPPTITRNMTNSTFRCFITDWDVYKNMHGVTRHEIGEILYSACDEAVRDIIINTEHTFRTDTEEKCLATLNRIVTEHSNPMIHRINFRNIVQKDSEKIQDFYNRLLATAVDCEFSCPNESCKQDLTSENIKDQFVIGLHNPQLQAEILTHIKTLPDLTKIITHAQSYECGIHDQTTITSSATESINRISEYKTSKRFEATNSNASRNANVRNSNPNSRKSTFKKPCIGCGSLLHANHERDMKCPAWGKTCHKCTRPNHFANVCMGKPLNQPDNKHESISSLLVAGITQKNIDTIDKSDNKTTQKNMNTIDKPNNKTIFINSSLSLLQLETTMKLLQLLPP